MVRKIALCLALCLVAPAAQADKIKLANGDELSGEIVEWAVDHVVIEHPQLGKVRLTLDQLEIDTGERPSPGLFGTGILRGWERRVDFGWTGRIGTTDTLTITAGVDFRYADEFRRWKLNGRYFFNVTDDGDQDNNARIDLRRDWLFPGHRWFAYAGVRYQFDQFESWEHRTTLSVGPGYNLVKTEAHKLDVRLGPTYTKEYAGPADSQSEALFGIDYDWKISERQSLHFLNDLFVEYTPSAGDFRNLTLFEWRMRIAEAPDLALKIGGSNEYDNTPDGDDERNDFRYYISLGVGF